MARNRSHALRLFWPGLDMEVGVGNKHGEPCLLPKAGCSRIPKSLSFIRTPRLPEPWTTMLSGTAESRERPCRAFASANGSRRLAIPGVGYRFVP